MSWPAERRMIVSAKHGEVRELAQFLQSTCRDAGVDELAAIDLELAMVEAANNVVEHGYSAGSSGTIELAIQLGPETATVTLWDYGVPAPAGVFERCRSVPATAIEGRGIGIVQSCVDRIEYDREGERNRLRLVKALGGPLPA